MIRNIYVSEIDRSNLSKLRTSEVKTKRGNYSNVVVRKPWGYEYLMFENDYVGIWILHLKKNHGTSMHCHPRKKSSLVVLSGMAIASTLTEWFNLRELDGLMYEEGVFHTTKALTSDTFVMEIETPPLKNDLVRLKDSYGREKRGYESKNQHSRDLKQFNYIFFKQKDIDRQIKKKLNDVSICLRTCSSADLGNELTNDLKGGNVFSIIEDKVIDIDYKPEFWPGAIFEKKDMENKKNMRLYNNCLLLILQNYNYG